MNDPADPGGETKYGISKRTYPQLNIKNLTEDQATDIYFRDWWDKFNFGALSWPISAKAFDISVNMGAEAAIKKLQRACVNLGASIACDGCIGPATIRAVYDADKASLLQVFIKLIAEHYQSIVMAHPQDQKYLAGWLRRANESVPAL